MSEKAANVQRKTLKDLQKAWRTVAKSGCLEGKYEEMTAGLKLTKIRFNTKKNANGDNILIINRLLTAYCDEPAWKRFHAVVSDPFAALCNTCLLHASLSDAAGKHRRDRDQSH